jgi:hypothetical protein
MHPTCLHFDYRSGNIRVAARAGVEKEKLKNELALA